jgi:hypothetical protein
MLGKHFSTQLHPQHLRCSIFKKLPGAASSSFLLGVKMPPSDQFSKNFTTTIYTHIIWYLFNDLEGISSPGQASVSIIIIARKQSLFKLSHCLNSGSLKVYTPQR